MVNDVCVMNECERHPSPYVHYVHDKQLTSQQCCWDMHSLEALFLLRGSGAEGGPGRQQWQTTIRQQQWPGG
jgi:hypothetical protein